MSIPTILQELEEIFSCGQYGRIDPFLQECRVKLMSDKERGLLVRLCLLYVKDLYRQDVQKASELLQKASAMSEPSAVLLFEIAKTYAEFSRNVPNLRKSLEFTQKSLALDPLFLEAWNHKVFLCTLLGEMEEDFALFTKGIEAYQSACLIDAQKGAENLSVWNIAFLYHRLHVLSQEPSDLKQSLDYFEKAAKRKEMPASFWMNYGDLLVDFSKATQKVFYVKKASHIFWKAIGKDPEEGWVWLKLALCLTKLFKEEREKKIYKEAGKCFRRASHFFSKEPALWAGWGTLELFWGKQTKSVASLQSAVEKLEQAEREGASGAEVMTCIADALLSWGVLKEDHHLLTEAINRARQAVDADIFWAEGWLVLGKTLVELGNYFLDERYYLEAVQKITQGILYKEDPYLFWIRGVSYYKAFEYNGDRTFLENSLEDLFSADGLFCSPPFPFYLDFAKTLLKAGDLFEQPDLVEKAISLLKGALQQYASEIEDLASFLEALYIYGMGLQVLGEFLEEETLYQEAHSVFQAVIKLDPDHTPSLVGMAETLVKLGQATSDPKVYTQAIGYLEHLAKKDPEDDFVFCEWGVALMHLADLLQEENPDAAHGLFQEAEHKLVYSASLGNGPSCYFLAALYSCQERLGLSLDWIEEAYFRGHLPSIDEMNHDEWLENVRELEEFSLFLKSICSAEEAEEEKE